MLPICSATHLYIHSFTKHVSGPTNILLLKRFKNELWLCLCFPKSKQTHTLKALCGNEVEIGCAPKIWRVEMPVSKVYLQKRIVAGSRGREWVWLERSLYVYFYHPCVG